MTVSVDIAGIEEGNHSWYVWMIHNMDNYCMSTVCFMSNLRGVFSMGAKLTLACYYVHGSLTQCKVRFLPHHLVLHAANYDWHLLHANKILI